MYELAPGNVLQNMYLARRLKQWVKPGMRFIELGPGNGIISRLMLNLGMHGTGVDLNNDACAINRERNADFITSGKDMSTYLWPKPQPYSGSQMRPSPVTASSETQRPSETTLSGVATSLWRLTRLVAGVRPTSMPISSRPRVA